jgi:hypothetical protein
MRLAAELLAGAAACGIAYYVARPNAAPRSPAPSTMRRAADVREERLRPDSVAEHAAQAPSAVVPRSEHAPRSEHTDAPPNPEQESAMAMLRNAAIVESSRSMHDRGQDIVECLEGAWPAGPEKLRFAVEVTSTPAEATLGQWRFVEVADGEPVPATFAACAARALGGGQHLVPKPGFRFPDYRGDLSILYTIPAPASG